MTVMAGSLQHAIDKMAASAIRADYVVSMANGSPLSPGVAKKLAATDGVTASSPLRNAESRIDGKTEFLTGVDGASIAKLTDLKVDQGSFTVSGTRIVVDKERAKEYGWTPGSRLTAHFEDGKAQSLTVAGIYDATT